MADSPLHDAEGPVSIEIRSNDDVVPDTLNIYSIRTRSEMNRVSEALIVVGDGDPSTGEFAVADSPHFKPGALIEIKAGYANRTKTIFKGIVTAVRIRIDSALTSRLEITCRHKASKMLQGRRRAIYAAERKDSELIKKVVDDAGLSVDIEATTATLPETVRVDVSDWNFIVNHAEINGMLVICTNDGLLVEKPKFKASAMLEVSYGEDLIAVDMEVSARGQFSGFKASSWNPATQAVEAAQVTESTDNGYGDLESKALAKVLEAKEISSSSSAYHDTSALEAYASARASRADLALAQGWVKFQGSALPQPNSVLQLKGLGNRFSGAGLVGGVIHRIEAGLWKTEAQFGLPANWLSDTTGFEASAVTTGTRGLVIGKVTKLNGDPKSLSRIQVKVPEFDDGATPLWARLGSNYASNNAGAMFLPEIDDEVVIGFLNDNPSSPVILGALHNPLAVPPEGFTEYDEANNTKAIISREQLKIVFNEEKKVLSIQTPGGNKISFDDDKETVQCTDQHKNTVTMDNSGIALDSTKDVLISATGDIVIKAGKNVKIEGQEVSADGSIGFKAKGGASNEITSGGTLKIQGSLVQIN